MDIIDRAEIFRLHADFCKILSDANRLLIISELAGSETSVNELVRKLGLQQSNVSKHLSLMREHGLVKIRKEGSTVFYSLADKRIYEAIKLLRQAQSDLLEQRSALAVRQT
jgi:DNA-binding transcriptional ArsR family regulator